MRLRESIRQTCRTATAAGWRVAAGAGWLLLGAAVAVASVMLGMLLVGTFREPPAPRDSGGQPPGTFGLETCAEAPREAGKECTHTEGRQDEHQRGD